MRCQCHTVKGTICRRKAKSDSLYCFQHQTCTRPKSKQIASNKVTGNLVSKETVSDQMVTCSRDDFLDGKHWECLQGWWKSPHGSWHHKGLSQNGPLVPYQIT